jgi:predicted O-methyltransferase YrrM
VVPDALSDVYMPVTPNAGRLLYALVRAARPATIVEFGMSFGISAIHLAAALRDNGTGRVITTELSSAKVAAAQVNFAEAGLYLPVLKLLEPKLSPGTLVVADNTEMTDAKPRLVPTR